MSLCLIHDGHATAFASCIVESVEGEYRAAEVEDADKQQDKDRQDESELHECLPAMVPR